MKTTETKLFDDNSMFTITLRKVYINFIILENGKMIFHTN